MILLDNTNICQFDDARVDSVDVEFSLTVNEILRSTCLSEKLSDFSTKKPDKNGPVAQQTPGSLPSQRPFFRTNDIIVGGRH